LRSKAATESIVIDGGITVTVTEIRTGEVRLGIEVPEAIPVRQVEERPVAARLS
jgi:carbon storage regulator CsrA